MIIGGRGRSNERVLRCSEVCRILHDRKSTGIPHVVIQKKRVHMLVVNILTLTESVRLILRKENDLITIFGVTLIHSN